MFSILCAIFIGNALATIIGKLGRVLGGAYLSFQPDTSSTQVAFYSYSERYERFVWVNPQPFSFSIGSSICEHEG